MNIRTNSAGQVSDKDFKVLGFHIFHTIEGNDMGQMGWSLPQYKKGNITITGGYWTYDLSYKGEKVFSGWWNSKEELEDTLKEFGYE